MTKTPAAIVATERRRDNELGNDDTISIVLDTFHDHRNAFLFRTNPLGTQYDALVTNEDDALNANWDEQWDVASRITPEGWTAEFAIPFKSLRLSEENGQGWGLDIERVIRRKNESSYWKRLSSRLPAATRLAGRTPGRHRKYRNGPAAAHTSLSSWEVLRSSRTAAGSVTRNTSDAGIEVMKYRITSSLTADLTFNTDFAQTEVDDQQVNLDRFPLFFPEKREFFQEGAGAYEIGSSGPFRNSLVIFHSRTIGLSAQRRIVPIRAGGRITGRIGGFTLGMLNVQTEELAESFDDETGKVFEERIPVSNYSVVRMKRDVFGTLFDRRLCVEPLNRRIELDFNRVYGVDANFALFQHFTVGGLLGRSQFARGSRKTTGVSAGEIGWDSDFFRAGTSWTVVDPEFRNDMGFTPRRNFRQLAPQFFIQPRPDSRIVRQLSLGFSLLVFLHARRTFWKPSKAPMYSRFSFRTAAYSPGISSYLLRPARGALSTPSGRRHSPGKKTAGGATPFAIAPIRPSELRGGFRWEQHYALLQRWKSERVPLPSGRASERAVFGGAGVCADTKPPSIQATIPTTRGVFPQRSGAFTDHVINTRINYNFNNQWLTSTFSAVQPAPIPSGASISG